MKYLGAARAARIVAECGAGKTFMALAVAHVLKAGTILAMCPSHIAKKWAREAIKTIPFTRTLLFEDTYGACPQTAHLLQSVDLVVESRNYFVDSHPGPFKVSGSCPLNQISGINPTSTHSRQPRRS